MQSPFVLHAVAAYERAFKLMEQTLAERGPWLLGEKPTLADINMMPFVGAAVLSRVCWRPGPSTGPRINEWWAQVQDWPSFKRGLADLVTATEFGDMRTHGLKVRDDIQALIAKLRDGKA